MICSNGLIYCDYYGLGFPAHRPAFPGAIRFKKIPFAYLGINQVNRYGFHMAGVEDDFSYPDDSGAPNSHDENTGGGLGLGLVRRYLGSFAPSNGYFPSLFSSHHGSDESGHVDRHGSYHGGGNHHKNRHGYGGGHGNSDIDHDLSFSHRDEHHSEHNSHSDRSPGLLGIRVDGLSWLKRPFGKGLFERLG